MCALNAEQAEEVNPFVPSSLSQTDPNGNAGTHREDFKKKEEKAKEGKKRNAVNKARKGGGWERPDLFWHSRKKAKKGKRRFSSASSGVRGEMF